MKDREGGFTLVEMMISLMIFGMLAAAGVALLSFSVRAQAVTAARLDDTGSLNRLASVLSADLAQAVVRPTRNEAGDVIPAFSGAGGDMVLVRAGWSNLDGTPRASAQKVEYRIVNGALQRIAWPMLDGAAPTAPAVLLDHIARATLRYRTAGAWSDRWDGTLTTQPPLPDVVELSIQRDDATVLRQLFLVGTGYDPRTPAPANAAPPLGGNANAGA